MSLLGKKTNSAAPRRKRAAAVFNVFMAMVLALGVSMPSAYAGALEDATTGGGVNLNVASLSGGNDAQAADESGSQSASNTAVSDAATVTDYESLLGTGKADNPITTANIGRIWTDKSVFTGDASDGVITVKKADGADFLTSLSAISSTSNLTSMSNTPLDIVLVLDASGSMDDPISDSSSITRISALKTAAKAFVDQVAAANAKTSDVDLQHKVSLVKFAGNNSDSVGNSTYSSGRYTYNYSQTMMNLTTCTSDAATSMKAMIDNISPGGATQAGYGMSHAKDELDKNGRSNAKKIVIFFTDGTPTSSSSWEDAVASSAVSYANQMKTNGATIYGINILSGSDATSDPTSSSTSNVNKFMHAVSSNYPSATYTASSSSSSSGRPGQGGGGSTTTYAWSFGDRSTTTDSDGNAINYFKTATSADELSQVFKDIEQQIVNGAGYPTKATDGAADTSGYIVMDDELGSYMEVTDLSTLVYNGKVYSNPTKSTTDNVDTYTFEGDVNAGASASNLNKVIITVTRSTDLATGDKVQVKVPASLIPLHHYNVDLTNTKMTADSTTPVVVCYSSAVKSGVAEKLANPDDAMKAYMASNTDDSGNVKFYANKWNGDASKGDVVAAFEPSDGNLYYYYTSDTALYTDKNFTTQATSIDENATYYYKHSYYTMNEAVVDTTSGSASGIPVLTTEAIELPGVTAKTYQDAGNIGTDSATNGLFVKDGTPRLNFINTLHKAKAENTTATASDVLNPEWASAATLAAYSTINSHLGNNGIASYFGDLNVKVTNNGGNANDEFEITVELKDGNGDPISGTFGTGDDAATFTDGKTTIKLKGDESKTISNVPAGATYTVTQTSKDGYSTTYTVNSGDPSSTPATGNIDPDNAQKVVITNTYSVKPTEYNTDDPNGDGSAKALFSKSITGRDWADDDEFTFTIAADASNPEGGASIEKTTATVTKPASGTTANFGFGKITFTKAGEYAFTVTETASSNSDVLLDSTPATLVIKVTDNGDGTLSAAVDTNKTVNCDFVNYAMVKSVDKTEAEVGDVLTYTIPYTNSLGSVADVKVTDTLSAGLTLDESSLDSNASYDANSRTITWAIKDVASAFEGTVTFKATINASAVSSVADDGTAKVSNSATLTIGNDAGVTATSKPVETTVKTGSLAISKQVTVESGSAPAAKAFSFTIAATDKGGNALTGTYSATSGSTTSSVVFDEKGSAAVSVASGTTLTISGLPEGVNYTVTENLSEADAKVYTPYVGDTQTASATGSISATQAATAAFVNKYVPQGASYDTDPQTGANPLFTKVVGGAGWDSDDAFVFTITADASNPTGGATLEKNTTKVTMPESGSVAGFGFGKITFTKAGTYKFNVSEETATGALKDDHVATLEIIVTDNDGQLEVASENVSVTSGEFDNYAPTKTMTVNGAAGSNITFDDTVAYTVTYKNTHSTAATVVVTDVVPTGITVDTSTLGAGVYNADTNTITWTIENVPEGTEGTVSFSGTVNASAMSLDSVSNTAKVKIGDDDPADTSTATGNVQKGDLIISKSIDCKTSDRPATRSFSFEVTAYDANGKALNGTFGKPDGGEVTFTDGKTTVQVSDVDYNTNSSYTIYNLPVGTTYTVTEQLSDGDAAVFTPYVGEVQTDTATGSIEAGDADVAAFTNMYQPTGATYDASASGLFSKTVLGGGWTEGAQFTFNITPSADNPAGATVPQTSVTVSAPASGDTASFGFGTIVFTQSGTYTYTITEANSASALCDNHEATLKVVVKANGDKLEVVEAESGVAKGDFSNFAPAKAQAVNGVEGVTNATIGDTITYTIGYANTQTEAATITIVDTVAAGLEVDQSSLDETASFNADTNTITWTIPNVGAGVDGKVTFVATVGQKAVEKNTVSNKASVAIGDNPAVSTNTVTENLSTGNLEVKVNNDGGDPDKEFAVTVTVVDKDGDPINGTYGDHEFVDGKTTITIKGGETEKFDYLPTGGTYTVTQTDENGYTTTYTVNGDPADPATGGIEKDKTQLVVITNKYVPEDAVIDTNSGLFSKVISGRDWTSKDAFAFTITALSEDAPMPAETTGSATSSTAKSGEQVAFGFGEMKFTVADIADVAFVDGVRSKSFVYQVSEVKGAAAGMTYDDTVIAWTVTLTDNGSELSVESSMQDSKGNKLSVPAVFTNTYNEEKASVKPMAQTGDPTPFMAIAIVAGIAAVAAAIAAFVVFRRRND